MSEVEILDSNGQPINLNLNRKANAAKSAYTLRGLLMGMSCDQQLQHGEVLLLQGWLELQEQTGDILDLADAIAHVIEDKKITSDEHDELLELISDCIEYGEKSDHDNDRINLVIGFLRGISADGEVSDKEFSKLKDVVFENADLKDVFPISAIYDILARNQNPSAVELNNIHKVVCKLVGCDFSRDGDVEGGTTELESDAMPDEVDGLKVCFTGKLQSGTRKELASTAITKGMIVSNSVTLDLDLLIIGSIPSRDWKFVNSGSKIQAGLKLKSAGAKIRLVTEENWAKFLMGNAD